MAVDPLLQEVDDAVRADEIAALWNKYRTHLMVIVAALILGSAGASLWNNYQEKRGGQLMLQFRNAERLFNDKKYDEAANGFATIAKGTDGELNNVASIWQARALVAAGKKEEAVNVLKATSAHASALWGDIACLRLASLDVKAATCLAERKATPLAWQRTQWAAANAWAAGENDKAAALLKKLAADEDLPDNARAEVTQWLATVEAQTANKKAPAEAGDAKPAAGASTEEESK